MVLPAHDSSINVPYSSNAVIDVQQDEVPRLRLSRKNAEAPRQTVMGMDTIVTCNEENGRDRTHVQYPMEMGVDCSVDRPAKSNPRSLFFATVGHSTVLTNPIDHTRSTTSISTVPLFLLLLPYFDSPWRNPPFE